MKSISILVFILAISFASPVFAADEKIAEKDGGAKSGFLSKLNFEKGTFLGDVNAKVVSWVGKVEEWRLKEKEVIKTSLDKIETRREDEKDPKPAVKVLTIIHISGLALALFVFSLQSVFWTIAIIVAIFLIRKLIHLIIRLFRGGTIRE